MKSILVSSLLGGGAISYAISYMTEPKPAMSVVYTQPQTTSAWLWSQIMWWLIPTAIVVIVAIAAFHGFVSGYTRLKYPAHRKISVAEAKRDAGIYDVERERKSLQVGTALARAQEREAREMARYATTQPAVEQIPSAITLQQAISQSTERAWIVGQASKRQANPDVQGVTGNLLTLDPQTTHIAIIGATGGGKTASSAMLLAVYARKFGVHPIVLDGKRGQDWKKYDGVVEWHLMTSETFEVQIGKLLDIFNKRWQWLLDNNYDNIYDAKEKRPQPLLVIFEEFGYVWSSLPKDKQAELTNPVNDLFRLCRSAGIILCFVDQAPKKWPDQARGNAKFVFCYKIKGMIANAFSEYFVDRLADYGMFSRDNVFYDAWFTAKLIDLNGMFQPLRRRYLETAVETANVSKTPVNAAVNDRLQVVETPINAVNVSANSADFSPIPPSLERAFMRLRCWESFCKGYLSIYPETTQAQLRKAMSRLDGREPDTFKTEAFKWFHMYSPQGDKTKIAGKFGFDNGAVKGMRLVA